jgi:hypothetical protein
MTNYPYILFNQPRRICAALERAAEEPTAATAEAGAPKGKHRRWKPSRGPVPDLETTAEAIAALNAQFSWLRGAGEPTSRRRGRPS